MDELRFFRVGNELIAGCDATDLGAVRRDVLGSRLHSCTELFVRRKVKMRQTVNLPQRQTQGSDVHIMMNQCIGNHDITRYKLRSEERRVGKESRARWR